MLMLFFCYSRHDNYLYITLIWQTQLTILEYLNLISIIYHNRLLYILLHFSLAHPIGLHDVSQVQPDL